MGYLSWSLKSLYLYTQNKRSQTMTKEVYIIIALAFCVIYTLSQEPVCVGRPDNWTVEIGCWGFKFCNSSKLVDIVNCTINGTVLDRDSKQCLAPRTGHTECGKDQPCLGKIDGYYADLSDNCISYYVCAGEVSLGRLYCAAHLVFSEKSASCDWISNVVPPCGTFQGTPSP
nr:chondroitin proteoglycan-2 [Biomphalaria glabrata]